MPSQSTWLPLCVAQLLTQLTAPNAATTMLLDPNTARALYLAGVHAVRSYPRLSDLATQYGCAIALFDQGTAGLI